MHIIDKLIELNEKDPIVHNVILGYIVRHREDYRGGAFEHLPSLTLRIMGDFKENILFDIMMAYKRRSEDGDKLILKIVKESQTPIIIDKENFIRSSKKKEKEK